MMLPDKVKAAGDGGNTGISIGGYSAERKPFVYVDFTCGAGGRGHGPTASTATPICSPTWLRIPSRSPRPSIRSNSPPTSSCRTRRARENSAAGFRLGATTGFWKRKACCRCAPTAAIIGHSAFTAAARAGHRRITSTRTPRIRLLPSKLTMTIKRGDVFRHVLAGAGGWGDPLERDSASVLRDVRNELLSPEKALADYGVVIDLDWRVDEAATARRRCEIAKARGWAIVPKVQRHDPIPVTPGGIAHADHLSSRCRHRRHLH